jgi:hypothetical protein
MGLTSIRGSKSRRFFLARSINGHVSTGSWGRYTADGTGKEASEILSARELHNWPQIHSAKAYVFGIEQRLSPRFVLLPRRRPFHPRIACFGGGSVVAETVGFGQRGQGFLAQIGIYITMGLEI